eukprot:c8877_g1_i1 orf=371-2419(-)
MALPTEYRSSCSVSGTIVFSTVGRCQYGFDIFCVAISPELLSSERALPRLKEAQLTDGKSVNFNGHFADSSSSTGVSPDYAETLVYISERTGGARIYMKGCSSGKGWSEGVENEGDGKPEELRPVRSIVDTAHHDLFCDRPSVAGSKVFFVSTQETQNTFRKCWTAVYSTSITSNTTVRLTPPGIVDFSPSVSPSGKWVAVASYQGRRWGGEVQQLRTDIWIFRSDDGSQRTLAVRNGGWPTWANDDTLFFHRRAEDGWWSVYKIALPANIEELKEPVDGERITPPRVHAVTPAASRTGNWIAVATRRVECKYRHIELFLLASKTFISLTLEINPKIHHYNPFVSPSSGKVGYHRCRVNGRRSSALVPYLEPLESPLPHLTIFRLHGSFPAFSPCGNFIAYQRDFKSGMHVLKVYGSKSWKISDYPVFGTAWDMQRQGVIYSSYGPVFSDSETTVHVVSISFNVEDLVESVDELNSTIKVLTNEGTTNNAFPCPSPDGKEIVFRSGRNGYKNLYIMDAEKGEEGGIRALTHGKWIDTMPHWSRDGQWIAFSSNRENPQCELFENFALYMVKPDGSGLHEVLGSSGSARVNHVCFSPDSKRITFAADMAGVSAEPISMPNQFQPYGEVFVANADGTEVVRLTHAPYENGTPTWSPTFIPPRGIPPAAGERLLGNFIDPLWFTT